jgi:hypothetical protein
MTTAKFTALVQARSQSKEAGVTGEGLSAVLWLTISGVYSDDADDAERAAAAVRWLARGDDGDGITMR